MTTDRAPAWQWQPVQSRRRHLQAAKRVRASLARYASRCREPSSVSTAAPPPERAPTAKPKSCRPPSAYVAQEHPRPTEKPLTNPPGIVAFAKPVVVLAQAATSTSGVAMRLTLVFQCWAFGTALASACWASKLKSLEPWALALEP